MDLAGLMMVGARQGRSAETRGWKPWAKKLLRVAGNSSKGMEMRSDSRDFYGIELIDLCEQ
jgi:hypothetical protein